MKLIDMHIHAWGTKPNPRKLIADLEQAGIWGACVMSTKPLEYSQTEGLSFDDRIKEILAWTNDYKDRLFPILWIHPKEENLCQKIEIAVQKGIYGFKMVCNDFYVYEEPAMNALYTIAKQNVPVFFHSGILWDGAESSKYNRPVHWEALSRVPGLRFSLGHCSWPWIDECFAVYGQFLNAQNFVNPAEMFFDTTPGTPEIYRKDLFQKLFTGGYDIGHNVMFGSDCFAHDYKPHWVKKWLNIDQKLLCEFGVSKENIENLYYHNVMRFLGKEPDVTHELPLPDNAGGWSSGNPEVPKIIAKWYRKLNFPEYLDEAFDEAIAEIPISDSITADTYDVTCKDGKRNLLSALYLCEQLETDYRKKGINEQILSDSLQEIVTYTKIYTDINGELSLGRMDWILRILSGKLFRLGRLLFGFNLAEYDIPQKGIKAGDTILQCYIPSGEKLEKEACLKSIEQAKQFFGAEHTIVVKSWLLDDGLASILPPESNILAFQKMFEPIAGEASENILKYVFRWDTNSFNIKFRPSYNRFSEMVKQKVLGGTTFYEVTGFLR